MPITSPIPLDAFERAIQADPDALGVFYFGSLGRGAATRHSDLDIFVVVPDHIADPYNEKLVPLLQLFGEIHWLEIPKGTGFVGPNWNQVDIEMARLSDLDHERSHRLAGGIVIKDADDGFMAAFVASCTPEQFAETPASAGAVIHDVIGDLLYGARNNARGALWEARGNIVYQASNVYQLLGRLRGRRTYGNRYAELRLTPAEQALFWAAWPREPTQDENRRATRALWEWAKHAWREAERAIGAPLEVKVDEQGMLAAIDRMYE
jgi:predicted nucleotidyltransferase